VRLSQALDRFVLQLQADGRSRHTIGQYRRHIRLLDRWLARHKRSRVVARITSDDLAAFLVSDAARRRPDGRAKRETAVNCLRSSLRAFFAYVHAAGLSPRNAAALVRRARCGTPPPRSLPPADGRKLLETLAQRRDARGRRDYALFNLLLGAGVRIGAALALRVEDLDLEGGTARLAWDKGNRPAQVLLPPQVVQALERGVGERQAGPVFESAPGRAIDARQVRRRLAQALQAAGIRRSVSPHGLRHSFATGLLDRTGNLHLVQRALHHRSIASTTVYAAVDDSAVRRALSV
jgi:integrase/recombinase XerC